MSNERVIRVTLLTQDHCGFCEMAKEVLQRLAQEYPLHITQIDVATPEGEALAIQGGILFLPGIFLDGKPCCYGRPSERKLRREFANRLEGVSR